MCGARRVGTEPLKRTAVTPVLGVLWQQALTSAAVTEVLLHSGSSTAVERPSDIVELVVAATTHRRYRKQKHAKAVITQPRALAATSSNICLQSIAAPSSLPMLNVVPSLFCSKSAEVAVALLCSCRVALLGRSQQQISIQSQHTLWPAQLYSTAKKGSDKRSKYNKFHDAPDPAVIAAKVKDAAPVQPTHRILKVIMQSEVPLTSHQVFDKAREEFGTAAFPTRREYKGYLHKLQHLMLIQSKPRQKAVAGDAGTTAAAAAAAVTKPKKKGKATAASEPYVYAVTHRALKVDLNEPGSPEQQEARSIADKWTSKHLSKYTDMLQQRKVPVTLDEFATIPRAERRLFQRDVK